MLTYDMLEVLCCPNCRKSELRKVIQNQERDRLQEGSLICDGCDISYPIHSGVPNLIPYRILDDVEWNTWKNHLEYFKSRREHPRIKLKEIQKPKKNILQNAFFDFAEITRGNVLDVGCGQGKLRKYLNNNEVVYYGLDPIPLPETRSFKYVRALGEYIPFQDSSFSHMVVISSLDHFHNLDAFFKESSRVLTKNGKIHILQNIYDGNKPLSKCKDGLHQIKNLIDERRTGRKHDKTPKHISEFTATYLFSVASDCFEVISKQKFNGKWYMPSKLFISMRPLC